METGRRFTPGSSSRAATAKGSFPSADTGNSLQGARVLVIDDDRELCWLIKEYWSHSDTQCQRLIRDPTASNGSRRRSSPP